MGKQRAPVGDTQPDSIYRLVHDAVSARVYELQDAAPPRTGRLFVSPKRVREWLIQLLAAYRYADADQLMGRAWYCFSRKRYAELREHYWQKHRAEVYALLTEWLAKFDFAKADRLAERSTVVITAPEYAELKRPHVINYFRMRGHQVSEEQAHALVNPARHLLVKARAGSGKTGTIAARAALLMEQELLDPDQILLLAFNKKAAQELRERMQQKFGYPTFRTALTFHSLAYRLVKPQEDIPSSEEEKNLLVEEAMKAAWTPRLRWLADRFFEATDDPEIAAEAEMDAMTHLAHRLTEVNHMSISGKAVKSKGEKWIADLLFAHDIRFEYEQVHNWDNSNYRPDFTIKESVAPYRILAILEHWGVSKKDPPTSMPFGDGMTAAEYRVQMAEKRAYWRARKFPLLETSVDDMKYGRAAFNASLLEKLKALGIKTVPLGEEELAKLVEKRYWNDLTKRMVQFIARAKNRRKSPADIKRMWLSSRKLGLRTRIFWRLAARVYMEYEKLLYANGQMDFQDLLAQAAEKIEEASGKLKFVPKQSAPTAADKGVDLAQLRWLLIDEYQDFNPGFDHLVTSLRRYNPDLRLFCVGDDWQAINSFAGSEPIFFREFRERLAPEEADEVLLQDNYRSSQAVVEVGNNLMQEHGAPSRPTKSEAGRVNAINLDKLYLPVLPAEPAVTKGFDNGFMGARCLEMCARLVLPALAAGKSVAILSRTNWTYGMGLDDLRKKLINLLGEHWQKSFQGKLQVNTIHKVKGAEADVVILTEIIAGRMPLLHQDTRLYAPFLPPETDAIEEARMDERRLFYVALTRARETLWILSESNLHSEFIEHLPINWVQTSSIRPLPQPVFEKTPVKTTTGRIPAYR